MRERVLDAAFVDIASGSSVREGLAVELVKMLIDAGADLNARDKRGDPPLVFADHEGVFTELLRRGSDPNAKREDGTPVLQTVVRTWVLPFIPMLELLKHGADIEGKDEKGCTALHEAAYNASKTALKLLIEHGADPNARNKKGQTPLHVLALGGGATHKRIEVAKELAKAGADPFALDADGYAPFQLAKKVGLDGLSKTMAEISAARMNSTDLPNEESHSKDVEHEALVRAVLLSDANGVDHLIASGVDLSRRDHLGKTVLHTAADKGDVRVVTLLLGAGADPNSVDKSGWTPLHWAAYSGKGAAIAKVMIARGADLDVADNHGDTPLHKAVHARNESAAKVLLAAGADLFIANNSGMTPLEVCAAGFPETSEGLLEFFKRTAVERMGKEDLPKEANYPRDRMLFPGNGTLIAAASRFDWPVVERLLETGHSDGAPVTEEELEEEGSNGWKALHLAAASGQTKTLLKLLDAGANPNSTDSLGMTPLWAALLNGRLESAEELLKRGADVEIRKANGGKTILGRLAIEANSLNEMELLLRYGAEVDARDHMGRTPLMHALAGDRRKVARLLLANAADPFATDNNKNTAFDHARSTAARALLEKAGRSRMKSDVLPQEDDCSIQTPF